MGTESHALSTTTKVLLIDQSLAENPLAEDEGTRLSDSL